MTPKTIIKIFAVVFIVAGILGLVYDTFSYTEATHEAKLGPLEFQVKEKKTVTVACKVALRKLPKEYELVFPWPYSYTYLWKKFGEVLRLAELPSDFRCKFHRIRRSVASHAEAAGANATAMLRHTKREITESYLDPRICTPQQPVDVLFRLTATA